MDDVVYSTQFDGNEWFVIGLTVIGFAAIWIVPRRFSPLQTTFTLLIGVAFGLVFDHTIEVPPFDFYDLGDHSRYELFDMISYIMYAPFGYLFIYGYERLRMFEFMTIIYLLIWACMATGLEKLAVIAGVFHYKHGYQWMYSFPIYIMVLSVHLLMYRLAFARDRHQRL
ncbi:hypothetical protein ACFFK0_30565 [Paenibacillus chartarius]|uniref:Uncharacterized protein n=1 Tax=Paenibacillus chartarius TaxID=747481 RepID=A0ABV6DVQ2_9BACL